MEDTKQDEEVKKMKNKIPSEEFIGNFNIRDILVNETLNETVNGNSLKINDLTINDSMNRNKRYEKENNANFRNYEKSNVDRSW